MSRPSGLSSSRLRAPLAWTLATLGGADEYSEDGDDQAALLFHLWSLLKRVANVAGSITIQLCGSAVQFTIRQAA